MNISLDELVDEFLNMTPPVEIKRPTFTERIRNFAKRAEIEKILKDEVDDRNAATIKLGEKSETFLNSTYYKDLVEPYLRRTIKGGIQRILREGENLTETQIKSEIAVIRKSLGLIGSIKWNIHQAKMTREKLSKGEGS